VKVSQSFALVPLPSSVELLGALRDVIDDAVTGHVVHGVLSSDVLGALARDDTQLYVSVGFFGAEGYFDIIVGADDGA
jgi:hypothetical protein